MSTEQFQITDKDAWLKARLKDITSTEVSALFHCNPYITEFQLWHQKKNGLVVALEENERMSWGKALETAIAEEIARRESWVIKPLDIYERHTELRIGASFDFAMMKGGTAEKGILEIKNVDALQYLKGWLERTEEDFEAPPHIEMQVQHQMAVSGAPFVYLGALVAGNRLVLGRRAPNEKVIDSILQKVAAFWDSIENNTPPEPDFERDAEFIASLYPNSNGRRLDATDNKLLHSLCFSYCDARAQKKEAMSVMEQCKAKAYQIIEDYEKIETKDHVITAAVSAKTKRRTFRCTAKEEAE